MQIWFRARVGNIYDRCCILIRHRQFYGETVNNDGSSCNANLPPGVRVAFPAAGQIALPIVMARKILELVEMQRADVFSGMDQSFDAFLMEPFGVEDNGMEFNVMSALARAGLDPWAEAARLAALPKRAAPQAIAKLLNLGGDSATADRLADLLPKAGTPAKPREPTQRGRIHAAIRRNPLILVIAWLAISVLFVLASPPSHRQPSGPNQPATTAAGH